MIFMSPPITPRTSCVVVILSSPASRSIGKQSGNKLDEGRDLLLILRVLSLLVLADSGVDLDFDLIERFLIALVLLGVLSVAEAPVVVFFTVGDASNNSSK